jgi:asparagine synthase (glutamine-hydrolysing)
MCGITGFINFRKDVPLGRYYENHLKLRHRGKDDEGFFALGNDFNAHFRGDDSTDEFSDLKHISQVDSARVVLGHRRLAILDLSSHGHQPMADHSGRYVMVYNGEIYNYRELRSELEALGNIFSSSSDSEVLLTAYSQWGIDCFRRLNGMWAVAIYDKGNRTLVLSRDRYGIKPLYYTKVGETLYFGSEVKFLLPFLPTVRMNEQRAKEYLVESLVDHHKETMFEGVCQLLPAQYLKISEAGQSENSYWHLPHETRSVSLEDAAEELLNLLTSAVDLRLRSDVPVGSLLSGGLDSTTIVCLVKQLLDNKNATNPFECFSAVFHEEEFSEKHYIEATVKQVEMPIHWVYPDPLKLKETFSDLLYHQEFPVRTLSVYSQWELMKKVASTDIKVLLNGQGSDEIFGGYSHHLAALAAEKIRMGRLVMAIKQAGHIVRDRGYGNLHTALMVAYELLKPLLPKGNLPRRPISCLNEWYGSDKTWERRKNRLSDRLSHDLGCSALPEYLRYEDRNSMAFTLESRLPFLDYRLVEWAFKLPDSIKIDDGISKRVLRWAVDDMIPASILERRDKVGFFAPMALWQRGVLRNDILQALDSDDINGRLPFLSSDVVRKQFFSFSEGDNNNWALSWRISCMIWWHQNWWK